MGRGGRKGACQSTPARAKPAPVLGAVKQTTLDRTCGARRRARDGTDSAARCRRADPWWRCCPVMVDVPRTRAAGIRLASVLCVLAPDITVLGDAVPAGGRLRYQIRAIPKQLGDASVGQVHHHHRYPEPGCGKRCRRSGKENGS
jgi:hypothetical protein